MTVEWVSETRTLNGVEWVAGGMLGDAYNDCMGACTDQCNSAGFTEPGALSACIAACPTTCLLYKVTPGGTPNKPSPCMTKCLADANSLSDPNARVAAIAACATTCQLQQAASCPAGTTKDASGKCVPIGPSTGCASNSDCADGQECVQGLCVDKCPTGQVRDANGNCAVPAPTTSSSSAGTWGLALLAAGAAAAIFFGLKPPAMTAADKAHAQRYKENPWIGKVHRSTTAARMGYKKRKTKKRRHRSGWGKVYR